MEDGGIIDKRRSRRSRVLLGASLDVLGIPLSVKLRNLSEVGAMIEGDCLPDVGTVVCFQRDGLRLKSAVVWVAGRCAGIAFERKLAANEVLRHIANPQRAEAKQFRRPGFRSRSA